MYLSRVVNAAGTDFELDLKYEMIKPIGHGAYGVVISAADQESNSKVGTLQQCCLCNAAAGLCNAEQSSAVQYAEQCRIAGAVLFVQHHMQTHSSSGSMVHTRSCCSAKGCRV